MFWLQVTWVSWCSPDGIVYDTEATGKKKGLLEMKYIQTVDSEALEDALLRKRICVLKENNITTNITFLFNPCLLLEKKW